MMSVALRWKTAYNGALCGLFAFRWKDERKCILLTPQMRAKTAGRAKWFAD